MRNFYERQVVKKQLPTISNNTTIEGSYSAIISYVLTVLTDVSAETHLL
jgi:hypothetical protein